MTPEMSGLLVACIAVSATIGALLLVRHYRIPDSPRKRLGLGLLVAFGLFYILGGLGRYFTQSRPELALILIPAAFVLPVAIVAVAGFSAIRARSAHPSDQ